MCFSEKGYVSGSLTISQGNNYLRMIQNRQGIVISAPEEISFRNNWIDKESLLEAAAQYGKSPYGKHLREVAEGRIRG